MLFPTGYPLPSCSPAELGSVSPAEQLLSFSIFKSKVVFGNYQENPPEGFSYTLVILPTRNGKEPKIQMARLSKRHRLYPFQFTLPPIGRVIDVDFFSRERKINYNSSFSVNG